MATQVTRSLSEIDAQLKQINTQLRAAEKETRSLDRALKLDPSNLTLAAAKSQQLQRQLELAAQKTALLKQRQTELRAESNKGVGEEAYIKLANEIAKSESSAKLLRQEMAKTGNTKLTNLQTSLQAVSRVATALIASTIALGIAFANMGSKIDDASQKYKISAENFQRWSNIFELATGTAGSFEATLQATVQLLGQVERGSSRAATSLATIGLTVDDIKGKSAADAFNTILVALQQIEDVDARMAAATSIFGNMGTNVSLISELTAEQIAAFNAELERAGLVTAEQAKAAGQLADRFDMLKAQFKAVSVELGTALVPLFNTLVSVGRTLAPILKVIADAVAALGAPGQVLLFVALGVVAVLPKLVALAKAMNVVLASFGANPIAVKVLLIASAIALLIILLVQLAKWISSIFGKKWNLDIDTSLAQSTLSQANGAIDSNAANSSTGTTTVVNDYSNVTVNVEGSNLTAEDVVDAINTRKIQIGG